MQLMNSPLTSEPTARAAVALERAETRREMLEYLADWGMALSKDICVRSMDSPYHPELKHDPGRAFAAASRAVRLTLAMEERVEGYILALCNGVAPAPTPFVADPPAGRGAEGREGARGETLEPARSSIERETYDVDEPRESREREGERLIEGEEFEAVLAGDFNAGVAVIRAKFESLPIVQGESRPGSSGPSGVAATSPPPEPETSSPNPTRPR